VTTDRLDALRALATSLRGFMPDDEGIALVEAGLLAGQRHPGGTMLEVGAWCGKSAVYLGGAAEATGSVLFSLDHHHGSEENQAGWEHHEADLIDPRDGRLNTLPHWQQSIAVAGLEHVVVGLVGDSPTIAAHFETPLSLLFIDGGHGEEPAWADFRGWTPKVELGGLLAIHDVFEDPADGGRPPYELFLAALASGEFAELRATGSLRVLERVAPAS
jgi:predicted O-methyltransferase YrrM